MLFAALADTRFLTKEDAFVTHDISLYILTQQTTRHYTRKHVRRTLVTNDLDL